MRSKTLSTMFALLLGLGLVASACSKDDKAAQEANSNTTTTAAAAEGGSSTTMAAEMGTIVDVAQGNPDFSTLVELVTAAGLGEALSGSGPLTVFAPTNEAFASLDPATVAALKADPKGALTEVLKLHVIEGKVDAAAATAAAGTCVTTLGGEKLKVEKTADGGLTIGGAPIVKTDIETSNGVIHVISAPIAKASTGC